MVVLQLPLKRASFASTGTCSIMLPAQRVMSIAFVEEKIATKRDLEQLEERLTYRLTLRMGSMIVASVATLAALMTVL